MYLVWVGLKLTVMHVVIRGWMLVLSQHAFFAVKVGEHHLVSQASPSWTWITQDALHKLGHSSTTSRVAEGPHDISLRGGAAREASEDKDQGQDYSVLCVVFGTRLFNFAVT